MRTLLQGSIILLIVALIVASWVLALAHQLDWGALNVERYASLRGSLYGAYTVVALSIGVTGAGLLLAVFKKEPQARKVCSNAFTPGLS